MTRFKIKTSGGKFTDLFTVDFYICDVIFENGRHVNVRELIFAENYQQTSFAAGAIANNY
uniref:Uncharacterized protein n=1 Tax=Romanomermis culicivorax TaxID=13658 RepID=A0A915J402_ROMCU